MLSSCGLITGLRTFLSSSARPTERRRAGRKVMLKLLAITYPLLLALIVGIVVLTTAH
jgi:hypothetical protein